MTPWLLRQLNLPDEFAGHLGEVAFAFRHPRVFWAGLALLVPLAAYIYLRQRRNLPSVPTAVRVTLTATRVLILLLLVVVLASPTLKLDHKAENKPIVAFLFDHSQSMQLPPGDYDEGELRRVAEAAGYHSSAGGVDAEVRKALKRISRAKLALSVVQNGARPTVEALAKKYDVRFYSFSEAVTRLGVDPAHPELPEPPNPGGPATHLGDSVGHILEESAGRQVAGIVLFTDGQNTGGRSPGEAARAAGAAGVPLFAVPVGSPRRLQDLAIVDLFTTGQVSVGDTARVAVTLESQGFDRRPVKVELRDGDRVLDSKEILLRSTEQQQVELTFKATEAGARYLTVSVPPQPEEPEYLRSNNSDTALVRVSDEKLKVLYVEGLPRWDFRFLKNALRRDNGLGGRVGKSPDIVLEAEWRRLAPPDRAKLLPRTLDEMAQYHTVILGDASPQILDAAFVELLDKAVRERGVGLVVQAGPLAMPHRFGDKLDALLPVRLKRGQAGLYPRGVPSFKLELAPEGALHEAMRFYDEPGRNQNAWEQMPHYFWAAAAERPSPGATVLAYNPVTTAYGKQPLIAEHYAGKGKVMFVGTDSTWLWRQNVGDRFFYKFWGQGLRSVARLDPDSAKKNRLEVRPVRVQPGEPAQVELMAFAPDGTPRTDNALLASVQGGGAASTVELLADPAVKGRYLGRFTPPAPGEYRVSYNPTGKGAPVEARLRVAVAPEEMRQPNVNRPALELLASASGGGSLVELTDLAGIPDRLAGESKFTELHREASLWDNAITLSVLIVLYSLDVGLRRLLGLS
jgi:hypothetical protein